MADRERMTVLQAAEALRVSDDTIRRGLTGKGPLAELLRDAGRRDNTGRWMIELTAAEVERHRTPHPRLRQPTPPEAPLAPLAGVEAAKLRELAEAARSAADAELASHREEIERLAAVHGAELGRLREDLDRERTRLTQTEREREEARVARAAAEGEAKGLRLALEEARRPFWRRWIG
jgi:hypothetical protein